MRINEITSKINEVLASPYEYSIRVSESTSSIRASFETATTEFIYRMDIQLMFLNEYMILAGDVSFTDAEGEIKITGKGDAFRVLATVLKITKEAATSERFIGKFTRNAPEGDILPDHVEILTFYAEPDEPSRVKLYDKLARNAPGYSIAKAQRGSFVLVSDKISSEKKEIILNAIG